MALPELSNGESSARVTLEGFVLAPDGSPADGAVVVSSAGGKVLTDVAGHYRLEVEAPVEATSVQITATGRKGTNLVASTSVVLGGAMRPTLVDPLALSLGSACAPVWVPTFGERPGINGPVHALAVHDDGDGPALYAGGFFGQAGSLVAGCIAKWNGARWAALGSGIQGHVRALAEYDDGGGPALYAGGEFTTAGFAPANRIAKWNGSSWEPLGSGMPAPSSP